MARKPEVVFTNLHEEHKLFDSPRACNQEEGVHLITYNNLILVHTYGFSSTEYSGVKSRFVQHSRKFQENVVNSTLFFFEKAHNKQRLYKGYIVEKKRNTQR